jgi:hypothetical protein
MKQLHFEIQNAVMNYGILQYIDNGSSAGFSRILTKVQVT